MIKFNRLIQSVDFTTFYEIESRLSHFSANFFYFEQCILKRKLSDGDSIDVILLLNGLLIARLPNGKLLSWGDSDLKKWMKSI